MPAPSSPKPGPVIEDDARSERPSPTATEGQSGAQSGNPGMQQKPGARGDADKKNRTPDDN